MTAKAPTPLLPLPMPSAAPPVRADQAATGAYVPPSQRIKLFSPADWEQFIQEWAHSLKTTVAASRTRGAPQPSHGSPATPSSKVQAPFLPVAIRVDFRSTAVFERVAYVLATRNLCHAPDDPRFNSTRL